MENNLLTMKVRKTYNAPERALDLQIAELVTALNLLTTNLPIYASNALAVTGGLKQGDIYRTGADPDIVCVVH
jgi:hypothetical protein